MYRTILKRIIEQFEKQIAKGVAKYGHTLDDCPDEKFDWKLMAMEEMIDCMQYQQKEISRLERENQILRDKVGAWSE